MSAKKRATSKKAGRVTEAHRKLAERFLAELNRSLQKRGPEVLEFMWTKRPKTMFKILVELALIPHRRLPEPPGFDRRRTQADVLQRLQARAECATCAAL